MGPKTPWRWPFLFDYEIRGLLRFGLGIFRTLSEPKTIVDPFEISTVEAEACTDR